MHIFKKLEDLLFVILLICTWLEMETVLQCGNQYSAFLSKENGLNILSVQEKQLFKDFTFQINF